MQAAEVNMAIPMDVARITKEQAISEQICTLAGAVSQFWYVLGAAEGPADRRTTCRHTATTVPFILRERAQKTLSEEDPASCRCHFATPILFYSRKTIAKGLAKTPQLRSVCPSTVISGFHLLDDDVTLFRTWYNIS